MSVDESYSSRIYIPWETKVNYIILSYMKIIYVIIWQKENTN